MKANSMDCKGTYNRHLGVAELSPEVLNGVEADESGNEQTDKLDTTDTTNADTSHEKPEEPFGLEATVALVVELGPAEDGGHGAVYDRQSGKLRGDEHRTLHMDVCIDEARHDKG